VPNDERPWDKSPRTRRDNDDDDDDWGDGGDAVSDRRAARREHLLAVANAQKGILVCIFIYFCVAGARFAVPPEMQLWVLLGLIPLGITATVFVFMLATRVYGQTAGIVLGILTLVPLVGLFVLLIVNQKATALLKEAGVHVGLLGANTSDIR